MTEERIITTIEKLRNAANNAGDFKTFLLLVKSFSEPAPPKDWRPDCFRGYTKERCIGDDLLSDGTRYMIGSVACKDCPYRKME